MDIREPDPLQALILRRLAAMGEAGESVALHEVIGRGGGGIDYDLVRSLARGERSEVLSARQAAALAAVLGVSLEEVEAAAIVLRST